MKTYLIYGFVMAFAGAVLAVVLYLLGFHSDPAKLTTAQIIGGCGGLVIGSVCIALGTRARRAEIPLHEEFGYGRALGAGVMIALFACLFNIVFTFLYATVINPGFSDVIMQAQMTKLEAQGITGAKLEGAEKMVRIMTSPLAQSLFGFVGGLFFGTIISLVTAAVFKRPAVATFDDPATPTVV